MKSRLGKAALKYASKGWKVFPLKPKGKAPLIDGGFKVAANDREQIKSWWTITPNANIGLWPGASGFIVVDVDGPEGAEHAKELGLLTDEPTLSVTTGREDGGLHLYFQHPEFSIGNKGLAPKLDVRGDMGYVILPPSVHPSGERYRWNGKLDQIKSLPPNALAKLKELNTNGNSTRRSVSSDSDYISEGGRNNTLTRIAGAMRRFGCTVETIIDALLEENERRCEPPLPDHEVVRIAESISRYEPADIQEDGKPPVTTRTITLADVKSEKVTWVWPGRIPVGKLTILDGDPGLGKSTMALDIASRLSLGEGMPNGSPNPVGQAGTVILTAEDGLADTIRPRLDASGADCSKIVSVETVLQGKKERMPTVADYNAIAETAHRINARLVIIDPLVAYLGENVDFFRDSMVRQALKGILKAADRYGFAVLGIRHLRKSPGKALYRGGGTIGLIGAARSGLLIAPDPGEPDIRILAQTKANLAKMGESDRFELVDRGDVASVKWLGKSFHTADTLLEASNEG